MRVEASLVIPAGFLEALANTRAMPERLAGALVEIGAVLHQATLAGFAQGTMPNGRPWEPLREATVALKSKQGFPAAILSRSLALRDSVGVATGADYVEIGSNGEYASQHMRGYMNHSTKVPARPFLGLPEGGMESIAGILMQHLLQK